MKPRNLLLAALVLAGLSGAVWWSKKHPDAGKTAPESATSPKIADIPAAKIESISVSKKDGTDLAVDHRAGKWAITKPEALPTDQDAVNTMVSSLSPITADNLVEDKASNLGSYGLTSPSLRVQVQQAKNKQTTLSFGDDVPAGSAVYVRVNDESKVYSVPSSLKSTFDKKVSDLRDKRLLLVDSNTVTSIGVKSGTSSVEFGKNNSNEWQIVKPEAQRAENFQVEDLLRKLTEAKMDLSGSADDLKKSQTAFASGQKVATATVAAAGGPQTLEVRKVKDDYYAHSSSVPGDFKVNSDLGKQLEKSPEEYRNKKLFDFGFSDPSKIETSGSAGDRILARSGTDWKSGGSTMDAVSVQSLIDKARDLAAAKFVTTGFGAPEFGLTVISNEGKKTERVEFSKTADGYIAKRQNEPTLYQIDSKSAEELVNLSKAVKAAAPAKKK